MSGPSNTKIGTYYVVYVVIAVLMFLNVALSFVTTIDPMTRTIFHFAIASVQVGFLSYVFMHLREADGMTWISATSGLFFVGIMFLFMITDYLTRHWAAF